MRCAQFVRSKKTDQPPKETVDKPELDLPSDTQETEGCDTAMAASQQMLHLSKASSGTCTNPTTPLDVVSVPAPAPVQSEAKSVGGRHLQPPTGNNSKLKHKCPFDGCTWRFATPYKLRRHLMSHTKETPYTCKECDRGFSVRYNLLMHIQTIHSQPFRFKCPVRGCKEGYPTQPKLNSHLKKVHKRDGKTMDIKPEPSDSVLTSTSVDSKRSHQCPECGKECGSPSKLATHIKTHSSDKPHKCTVQGCDKAFATKDRLTRHLETHKNAEQFPCPNSNCSRVFIRQSHLQSHLKTHTQEPFTCRVVDCNEKFSTEGEYNEHLNSHMNFEHRCPYKDCGQTFSVFKRLDIHCKMVHHTSVEEARSRALKGTTWPTTPPPLVSLHPPPSPHDQHHSDPELSYIKSMPSNCELPDLKLEDIDTVISDTPTWREDHRAPQEGFVPHITIKREPRVSMEYESDGGYYSSPSMQSTATSAPFSSHSISPVLTPVNLSPALVSPCHCFFPPSHSFFHSPIPDTPSPRENYGFFRHPYSMVPSPLGTPEATYSPTFPPSYYSSVFLPMSPYTDSHTYNAHGPLSCSMNATLVRDSTEYLDFLCPAPSSPKFPDPAPMIPPLIPDRQPKCEEDQRSSCQVAAKATPPDEAAISIKSEVSSPSLKPASLPGNVNGSEPEDLAATPIAAPAPPTLSTTTTAPAEKITCPSTPSSPKPWYQQGTPVHDGYPSSSGEGNTGSTPSVQGPLSVDTPPLSSSSQCHERKVYASIVFTQPSTSSVLVSPSRDGGSSTLIGVIPSLIKRQGASGSKPVTPRKGKGHRSNLNKTAKSISHKRHNNYQWPKSINSANLVAFRDYILKKLKKEPGENSSSRSPYSLRDTCSSSPHPQSPAPGDMILMGSSADSMLSGGSPCGCHDGVISSDCSSMCNEESTAAVQDMDCGGLLPDLRPSSLLSIPTSFAGQDEIDTFLDDLESSRSVVGSPLSENPAEMYSSFVHSVEVDSDFEVTGGDLLTRNMHPHFGSLHDPEQDSIFEITESMGSFL